MGGARSPNDCQVSSRRKPHPQSARALRALRHVLNIKARVGQKTASAYCFGPIDDKLDPVDRNLHVVMYLVSWPSPLKRTRKGGLVTSELSQTLECGATNQIAPFAINAQSAQFIMKIIFTKDAPYGGARVQKGSIATSSVQKTSSLSSDHLSPYQSDTAPSVGYSSLL